MEITDVLNGFCDKKTPSMSMLSLLLKCYANKIMHCLSQKLKYNAKHVKVKCGGLKLLEKGIASKGG